MLSDIEIRKIPLDLINPAVYNPRVDLTPDTKEYKRLKNHLMSLDMLIHLYGMKRQEIL